MRVKLSVLFSVFLSVGLIAGMIIQISAILPVFSPSNPPVILIDAGHGAPDGGAVGVSGALEKDINLSIALIVGEVLEGRGFSVIYTRTGDEGIYENEASSIREMKVSDMHRRRDIMEESEADLFISIHMNSFSNSQPKGLHIFYSAQHEKILPLAQSMQESISSLTGAEAHSVKTVSESLFLMKNPPVPCILAECGFLSNPQEEKQLSDSGYQSKIGWAIADSICKYYDFK